MLPSWSAATGCSGRSSSGLRTCPIIRRISYPRAASNPRWPRPAGRGSLGPASRSRGAPPRQVEDIARLHLTGLLALLPHAEDATAARHIADVVFLIVVVQLDLAHLNDLELAIPRLTRAGHFRRRPGRLHRGLLEHGIDTGDADAPLTRPGQARRHDKPPHHQCGERRRPFMEIMSILYSSPSLAMNISQYLYGRRATSTTVWWVITSRSPSCRTCSPAGSPGAMSMAKMACAMSSSGPAA